MKSGGPSSIMKIIQILHHSLSPFKPEANPKTYDESWHVKVARQLKERTEYEIECWRPECTLNKSYRREDKHGITHRIFPSTFVNAHLEYSRQLCQSLKSEDPNSSILHFHGIYNFHTYMLLRSLKSDFQIIAQSHGGLPAKEQLKTGSPLRKLTSFIEYPLQLMSFPKVDRFLCLTQEESTALSRYANSIRSPMGVDFNKYRPSKKDAARTRISNLDRRISFKSDYNIHYIGRLIDQKGIGDLLIATRLLSDKGIDISLHIAGTGNAAEDLKKQSEDLGIQDSVHFLGFVPEEYKTAFYNSADVICFPSKSEPYGLVPVESLACETPVVATDVGAVNEIAENFAGGVIICDPNNAKSLANSLQNAYDQELKDQINVDLGMKFHSWDSIIESTLDSYNLKSS